MSDRPDYGAQGWTQSEARCQDCGQFECCCPLAEPDRSDRDEMTDKDDLAALLVQHQRHRADCLCGWDGLGRSLPDHQADVIIAAGWIHWPHDCDTEAELIAQWARTSFDTMQELHRLKAENAALRRRLVELAAMDPSESVDRG